MLMSSWLDLLSLIMPAGDGLDVMDCSMENVRVAGSGSSCRRRCRIWIELSVEVLDLERRATDGEDELLINHAGSPDLNRLLLLLIVGAGREEEVAIDNVVVARWSPSRLDLSLL
ncbi:hypothetical protein ACLOJK_006663 [Asimina triloba]